MEPEANANSTIERPDLIDSDSSDRAPVGSTQPSELVEEDLLVEEVSIDGMCGVY